MSPVQLHLALNHFPVMGVIFAFGLLAFALAAKRQETLRVGLFVLVLSALAVVPVSLSGQNAEAVVEGGVDVPGAAIHAHEDAARPATLAAFALGAAALVGLLAFRSRPVPRWFGALVLFGALVVSALMARTANLGGKIAPYVFREDEIRQPEPSDPPPAK